MHSLKRFKIVASLILSHVHFQCPIRFCTYIQPGLGSIFKALEGRFPIVFHRFRLKGTLSSYIVVAKSAVLQTHPQLTLSLSLCLCLSPSLSLSLSLFLSRVCLIHMHQCAWEFLSSCLPVFSCPATFVSLVFVLQSWASGLWCVIVLLPMISPFSSLLLSIDSSISTVCLLLSLCMIFPAILTHLCTFFPSLLSSFCAYHFHKFFAANKLKGRPQLTAMLCLCLYWSFSNQNPP